VSIGAKATWQDYQVRLAGVSFLDRMKPCWLSWAANRTRSCTLLPIISFKPSATWPSTSGRTRLILRPIPSTDRVLIWLIHPRPFGKFFKSRSRVKGNPARCGWLLSTTAMTVPERSLKMS
jgi:hypothetical protein